MQAETVIEVSLKIHPKTAVVRTCYALSEIGSFWLTDGENDNKVLVNVSRNKDNQDIEEIRKKFSASLIDFTLREQIEDKTKEIRNLIVSAALSGLDGAKNKK